VPRTTEGIVSPGEGGGRTVSVLVKPAKESRNKIQLHKRTSNFIKENEEFFSLKTYSNDLNQTQHFVVVLMWF
jgi:hypothetical protein